VRATDPNQHVAIVDIALGLKPAWLCAHLLGVALGQADQRARLDLLEGLDALASASEPC
jgi:hypothetical protein